MKNLTGFALFVAATLITVGNASAQQPRSTATVPFNFAVGDRTLPAGTYTMTAGFNSPSLLDVNSRGKDVHVMALGQPDLYNNPKHADELVFDRVGDKYYLREIRSSNSSMNIHFATTKAEKRAKAQIEEAGLFVDDPVLIALN